MGARLSRSQGLTTQSQAQVAGSVFKYPPKTGAYFANYFLMGGERFDSPQPEAFLFGDNSDLNFLSGKPVPFPYAIPAPNELAKPLKSVINIRRESLRLVRIFNENGVGTPNYNLEFTFDCNVDCVIKIMYFAKEEVANHGLIYTSRDSAVNSQKFMYSKGANQLFNQPTHSFCPNDFDDDELANYNEQQELIPVVIHCVTADDEEPVQTHVTLAVVERAPDGSYSLKALKQKQCIDGVCYLLQEVYGIENKHPSTTEYDGEDECEDSGAECVVCMSDARDTLILPCRHLCLCNGCAESLRYQASNCPICRVPFRALLQIRAVQKREGTDLRRAPDDEENVPSGYELVSLLEALNGPVALTRTPHVTKAEKNSPSSSPGTNKVAPEPRPRKKSKKVTIAKVPSTEPVAQRSSLGESPSGSIKSNLSRSVPALQSSSMMPSTSFSSVPRGLDRVDVVDEVAVSARSVAVRALDEEEEAKDSDHTNDSNSSARSFNVLIRRTSGTSNYEEDETPSTPAAPKAPVDLSS